MAIEITTSRERLAEFLRTHGIGVLATSSREGKPHAATVYLTCDQQFNIYFVTKKDTQKSRNLQENGQAAIAIYDAASQTTVQAEGAAVAVTDVEQATWIINDIWRIAAHTGSAQPPIARLNGNLCAKRAR
jgi:general stress protein 26